MQIQHGSARDTHTRALTLTHTVGQSYKLVSQVSTWPPQIHPDWTAANHSVLGRIVQADWSEKGLKYLLFNPKPSKFRAQTHIFVRLILGYWMKDCHLFKGSEDQRILGEKKHVWHEGSRKVRWAPLKAAWVCGGPWRNAATGMWKMEKLWQLVSTHFRWKLKRKQKEVETRVDPRLLAAPCRPTIFSQAAAIWRNSGGTVQIFWNDWS